MDKNSKTNQTKIMRTRRFINDAFISLIIEKGFNNITVLDISRKAGINRGTFYLHYQDKFDLMAQLKADFLEKIEIILQAYLETPVGLVVNQQDQIKLKQAITQICLVIETNFKLVKALASPEGDPYLRGDVRQMFKKYLALDQVLKKFKLLIPLSYAEAIIIQSLIDIIETWIVEETPRSAAEIAEIILISRFSSPYGLIEHK